MFKYFFSILLGLLSLPFVAKAAVLYFDPADNYYGPGDEFSVAVRIDVNTSCINTIEAEIEFPREQLLLKDFLVGESIISLWLSNPALADMPEANKDGRLYFAGGIPGGYCGRIPGDPGESNYLGRLIFQLPKFSVGGGPAGELEIKFGARTRVFQNDGFGTEDIVLTRTAAIFRQDEASDPDLSWDSLIRRDKIPPEPFIIEVRQDDRIFAGRYYLIFNTVDKQSGIDHYEVLEIRPDEEVGISKKAEGFRRFFEKDRAAPDWVRAEMPYVLKDQSLASIIRVRAIDRAGNVRTVEYVPPYAGQSDKPATALWPILAGAAILAILILALFIALRKIKKFKSKPHDQENN